MRIKELFKEDDAVSPVIGVILMVAITVILAAVIASFVLGLGDTADEVQPTSSIGFDYSNETGENATYSISIADGDSINTENLYLRGSLGPHGGDVDETFANMSGADVSSIPGFPRTDSGGVDDPGDWQISLDSSDELSAGQGLTIDTNESADISAYDIDIVWDTGDDSATLDSDSGPEA